MKRVIIAVIALTASCKDKPRTPPTEVVASGAPLPTAVDAAAPVLDICQLGLTALDKAACPTPELLQGILAAKKSLTGVVETVGKLAVVEPTKFQVMCGQLLLAIERDALKAKCTIELSTGDRAKIATLLDTWYAQRTPVAPTGDASADAFIAKIVAVRDAACACKDDACLQGLDGQLVGIGTLPATAPDAARTLGGKLLEDMARCASRIKTLAP